MADDPGGAEASPVGILGNLPDHLAWQVQRPPDTCAVIVPSTCAGPLSQCRRRRSPPLAAACALQAHHPPSSSCAHPTQVLHHLDHRDCAAAAGVCSRWRQLAADETVWQAGYARSFPAWGAERTLDPASQQAADALRWVGAAADRAASCALLPYAPAGHGEHTSKRWLPPPDAPPLPAPAAAAGEGATAGAWACSARGRPGSAAWLMLWTRTMPG